MTGSIRLLAYRYEVLPGLVLERFRESLKDIMPDSLSAIDRIPGIGEGREWVCWW